MHRLLNGVFLVLLSCSLGLHWVALQGVAWTSMLLDRVPSSGWTRALETTFDGKHPCRLCQEVRSGQAESKDLELTHSDHRIELIPTTIFPVVLARPQAPAFASSPESAWHPRVCAPDVPPPRQCSCRA